MKNSEILKYWFGAINNQTHLSFEHEAVKRWNDKSPSVDQYVTDNFEQLYLKTLKDIEKGWRPRNLLGFLETIILIDQFPRHIYRDTALMYKSDAVAVELTKQALDLFDHSSNLNLAQRMFLYMPLMHSENVVDEELMLNLFEKLRDDAKFNAPHNFMFFEMTYGYAARHLEIVQRFGRFPHRNGILGRVSSAEELDFLQEENSSF